jgi:formylglycine-generating enzyme required for sulfatase activity
VIRGGSWEEFARHCRAASRQLRYPNVSLDDHGFRVAMTLAKETSS